jgi:bacterioferritin (cytochrome b1)
MENSKKRREKVKKTTVHDLTNKPRLKKGKTRDEIVQEALQQEEMERESLKKIMIGICTFIEEHYKEPIT